MAAWVLGLCPCRSRLFVAVWPDPAVQLELVVWQRSLPKAATSPSWFPARRVLTTARRDRSHQKLTQPVRVYKLTAIYGRSRTVFSLF